MTLKQIGAFKIAKNYLKEFNLEGLGVLLTFIVYATTLCELGIYIFKLIVAEPLLNTIMFITLIVMCVCYWHVLSVESTNRTEMKREMIADINNRLINSVLEKARAKAATEEVNKNESNQ
jgi:hypothetical protein